MQKLRFSRYFKGFVILLDILVLSAVFFIPINLKRNAAPEVNWEQNILTLCVLSLLWILLSGHTKLYNIQRNLTYTQYLERLMTHLMFFVFGYILLGRISSNIFLNSEQFLTSALLIVIFFLLKSLIFFALKSLRIMGLNYRNVMFLGKESPSRQILENIFQDRRDYGFKIHEYPHADINIEELKKFWKEKGIYTLYLPAEQHDIPTETERQIMLEAEKHGVFINLVPDSTQNNFFRYELNYVETQPVFTQVKMPLDYFSNFAIKRFFDVVFSVLILVLVCSWLFPIIALLIKLGSKGPIFFVQQRYGFHNEVFNCIKFRTMYYNPGEPHQTTVENDSRITAVGKFLRKTSLDELPQFWNVLKGEMSVVGPRPHMLPVDDHYKSQISRYKIRSLVKPGITGLAQVNGLRGDQGDMNIEMRKRVLADSFYVKNWSLMLDFVIVLKTAFLLISGDKNAR